MGAAEAKICINLRYLFNSRRVTIADANFQSGWLTATPECRSRGGERASRDFACRKLNYTVEGCSRSTMLIEFVERELCIAWGGVRFVCSRRRAFEEIWRRAGETRSGRECITIKSRSRSAGRARKEALSPGAARESAGALYSDKMILSIVNAPARRPVPVL